LILCCGGSWRYIDTLYGECSWREVDTLYGGESRTDVDTMKRIMERC